MTALQSVGFPSLCSTDRAAFANKIGTTTDLRGHGGHIF